MTVLIADDHFAVREGLRTILTSRSHPALDAGITVVGETSSLDETRRFLGRASVDLVLLDIHFPDGNGLELVRERCAAAAASAFLILSMDGDGDVVLRALQAGARGFVDKSSVEEELLEAVAVLAHGHVYLGQSCLDGLSAHLRSLPPVPTRSEHCLDPLSAREKDVFSRLLRGESTKEIAYALSISPKTVENHRGGIYRKLNLDGLARLLQFGRDNRLI